MNHYLLSGIAILTVVFHSFSQHSINWGPEISVADGSVYGNIRPRLALTAGNEPVVVFGKNGGNLHAARWNGTAFGTPVDILPVGILSYLANWTGPDIAAHGDTVIATFKAMSFENGKVYAVRSTDGGLTFSDTIRVDDHETGRVWMPSIAMDADGQPVINYMAFEGSSDEPRWMVSHSTDAGLTYSSGSDVSSVNSGEGCDCCPAEMVIDGNRQVLLYRNNENNTRDIHAAYSTDGGTTFPSGTDMEELGWSVMSCPSTGPHGIFHDGNLYTASASRVTGSYRVYLGSAQAGATLDFQQVVSPVPPNNTNGTQNFPRISNDGDTLVLVWEEKETTNADIFCSVSIDGQVTGLTTFKSRVNAITTSIQTNPDVIVKDGFVHVVFQDSPSGDVIYKKGTIIDVTGLAEGMSIQPDIYPNPSADGTFGITGLPENDRTMRVVDLSGKTVESTFGKTENGLNVSLPSTVESGVYLLVIESENGNSSSVKLIVQR
jgi:hypothetical protein